MVSRPEDKNSLSRKLMRTVQLAARRGSGRVLEADSVRRLFTRTDETFFQPMRLRVSGSDVAQPYSKHAWTYAAVHAKGLSLSQVPFRLYKQTPAEEAENDPGTWIGRIDIRQAVFDSPNPLLTGSQLIEGISVSLDLDGEALLLLVNSPDGKYDPRQWPTQIWLLPNPRAWEPTIERGMIIGWQSNIGGKTVAYPGSSVIQLKLFNPYDVFRGLAPADAVRMGVNTDNTAALFNRALMENGGDPGGVLTTDITLDDDTRSDMEQKWEERHKGAVNAGNVAILEGGITYTPFPVKQRDMQFIDGRKWSREEVLAVYGVPKLLVGLIEDVNRNTAKETMRLFWDHVQIPRLRMITTVMQARIFDPLTAGERERIYGEFDLTEVDALQRDVGEVLDQADKAAKLGMPLNEVNRVYDLGFDDYPWGSEPLVNSNLVPISVAFAGGNPENASAGKDVPSDRIVEIMDVRGDSTSDPAWPGVRKSRQRSYEAIFGPTVRGMRSGYRAYLSSQKAAVLANVAQWAKDQRKKKAALPSLTKKDVDTWLGALKDWQLQVARKLHRPIRDGLKHALRRLAKELGGFSNPVNLNSPWVNRHGLRRLGQMVKLSTRDRMRMRRVLLDAIGHGKLGDIDAIRTAIRAQFATMSLARAQTIAQTEAGALTNGLRIDAFKREKVKKIRWRSKRDKKVRTTHNEADAEGAIKLGDTFPNGMRWPYDVRGTADEIVRCRCWPEAADDDEEE